MDDRKISFEHYACLASSADCESSEQLSVVESEYHSHYPLYEVDKGYNLYELHLTKK